MEELSFTWGPAGGETLASVARLRKLHVAEWAGGSFPLGEKKQLRSVRIETKRRAVFNWADLRGAAEQLTEVDISAATLSANEQDVALPALRTVSLKGCQFPDLSFLAGSDGLEELDLENCGAVPSLAPLTELPRLRVLMLSGSTRVTDGDLDVLYRFPALREVAIERNFPNYTRKAAQVRADFPISDD